MRTRVALASLLLISTTLMADDAVPPASPAPSATPAPAPADGGDLYSAAKQLFDQYAPADVKAQYDFPTQGQFDQFMLRLQAAIDSGSFADMAAYEPQARAVLKVLRTVPGQADQADWLESRLGEIDEASEIASEEANPAVAVPPPAASAPIAPEAPGTPQAVVPSEKVDIPYYNRWLERMRRRPMPANASRLMPVLRKAFAEEGVPPELAWVAEVESSLNPGASSPAGARGLFQLKAETARELGLSTFLPDERTDPKKSAHAAARDLRTLDRRFGSWLLALAAYNAGEGRVSRALASRHADDFAGIASALPAGTRLYVPEVCALIAVRTGVTPDRLGSP
jgi:membrane-bound lytic murein transglycosylase D